MGGRRESEQVAAYSFRLYVTGRTPRSHAAESNLRRLCHTLTDGDCEVEVIDTVEYPERAAGDHIMATPTVIRLAPSPQLRVIGDLSDLGRAAAYLGFPDSPPLPER
ncbi:circadian clock protein KaiB [Streptomyces botrytidirepellens]|uniref:Circadian clock protein KaiB n=1 Tax=Streptomyces botrytidirepellens TaxID=2486417 RepID=A0A3M8VMR1_9ACTN|nr:circadian clock protein KaiB [Streptomyces botrytidirepellens]